MHSDEADSPRPPIRIGGVSYLNSKPLLWNLEAAARRRGIEVALRTAVPSELARELSAGKLDVGLISSVEYLRAARLEVVSDACVSSFGAVHSVKVLGRVPPEEVHTLALDAGSRSSAVLAQVLFREFVSTAPQTLPFPLGTALNAVPADAVLVIGDRAMRPTPAAFTFEWDLGAKWKELTGLPFVFAVWIAPREAATAELAALLSAVRDEGLTHLEEIAAVESRKLDFDPLFCLRYLRQNLRFRLEGPERAGLEEFRRLAEKHGLL